MSLTRKMLKGMGLTEEQVDSIIEEHTSVTDSLKEQARKYEADAKRLADVQKELDSLKSGTDDWEAKYNDEHKKFEDYKKSVDDEKHQNAVKSAYKALLKAQNVDEKRIDKILKVTDLASLKLGKDGKFSNEDDLVENIKSEWSDFIVSTSQSGAKVDTPPAGGTKMTKEQIMSIKDASKRQEAIANNLDLFGH